MKIAWTTTETLEQAKSLSKLAIENKLAACAQISGPITSIYRWKETIEESREYRITFKFPKSVLDNLRKMILQNHPYDVPQWVATDLTDVDEAYRSWAEEGLS